MRGGSPAQSVLRRLIVPRSCFIEKPFQNWTREGAAIIGSNPGN